ncbi:MAG: hypothetical protein ABSG56_30435 [Bryobacteraceae bacterium]
MKEEFNKYGRRLTGQEYDKAIIALYTGLKPDYSEREFMEIRRKEINLQIDHRLGVDFPPEKRETVWEVIAGLEKKRIGMALGVMVRQALGRKVDINAELAKVADEMIAKTGRILDKEDMVRFLGPEDEWTLPHVPDDPAPPRPPKPRR